QIQVRSFSIWRCVIERGRGPQAEQHPLLTRRPRSPIHTAFSDRPYYSSPASRRDLVCAPWCALPTPCAASVRYWRGGQRGAPQGCASRETRLDACTVDTQADYYCAI